MLNFDVRPSIVAGFALHWAWIWMLFWSSTFYSALKEPTPQIPQTSGPIAPLEPLWTFSFLGLLAMLLALFFISRRITPLGMHTVPIILSAALASVGTLLVVQPDLFNLALPVDAVYITGAVMTGFGSAFSFVLWGELLITLGARQTVVYFVTGSIASAAVYFAVVFLPPMAARMLSVTFPIIGMVLFSRQRSTIAPKEQWKEAVASHGATPPEDRKSTRGALLRLAGISLFFGVSYGIMKGLFAHSAEDLIFTRDLLNALALVLGSVAIFVTMAVYRMNFKRMTYQIALPLMASGFLFFPLATPANLLGFTLHQIGYQYFYTIIWAIWPVLALRVSVPRARIACTGVLGVQSGQFFGSLIGAALLQASSCAYDMAMISATAVFVILLVALFAFGGMDLDTGWGTVRPFGQEQGKAESPYRRSYLALAKSRKLSPRETEVFELLVHGRNRAYISQKLVISESTTKTHVKNIYRKFGVHSHQALIDMVELDAKRN